MIYQNLLPSYLKIPPTRPQQIVTNYENTEPKNKKCSFLGTKKRVARRRGYILAALLARPGSYPWPRAFRHSPSLINKNFYYNKKLPQATFLLFSFHTWCRFLASFVFLLKKLQWKKFRENWSFLLQLEFFKPIFWDIGLNGLQSKASSLAPIFTKIMRPVVGSVKRVHFQNQVRLLSLLSQRKC